MIALLRATNAVIAVSLLSACAPPLAADAAIANAPPAKLGLCVGCHGARGIASLSGYPHLAGQDAEYLRAAVNQYRDGSRPHAAMRAAVNAITQEDLDLIVAYYATLPRDGGL